MLQFGLIYEDTVTSFPCSMIIILLPDPIGILKKTNSTFHKNVTRMKYSVLLIVRSPDLVQTSHGGGSQEL